MSNEATVEKKKDGYANFLRRLFLGNLSFASGKVNVFTLAMPQVFLTSAQRDHAFSPSNISANMQPKISKIVFPYFIGKEPQSANSAVNIVRRIVMPPLNITRSVFEYLPRVLSYAAQKNTYKLTNAITNQWQKKTIRGPLFAVGLSIFVAPPLIGLNVAARILSASTQFIFSPRDFVKGVFNKLTSFSKTPEIKKSNSKNLFDIYKKDTVLGGDAEEDTTFLADDNDERLTFTEKNESGLEDSNSETKPLIPISSNVHKAFHHLGLTDYSVLAKRDSQDWTNDEPGLDEDGIKKPQKIEVPAKIDQQEAGNRENIASPTTVTRLSA